jgi:ubiquinone/menaquinone biosynthesis methyltransferase
MVKDITDVLRDPEQKKSYNEQIFSVVAPRYDLVTKLLSFGQDAKWKKRLIELLPPLSSPRCLDLACGTGDLTFALARKYPGGTIEGIDITPSMIERAEAKNTHPNVRFALHDICALPHADGSVDVITGGYALRNVPDLAVALREISRVLKPGGVAAFLDFSKPAGKTAQKVEYFLLEAWGSLWGRLLHGDSSVYEYISGSLLQFPDRQELIKLLADAGLHVLTTKRFLAGFTEITTCRKGPPGIEDGTNPGQALHHRPEPALPTTG